MGRGDIDPRLTVGQVSGIDIGDVNLLNAAGTKINPATSDAQASLLAAVEPYSNIVSGSVAMTAGATAQILFATYSNAVEYLTGAIVKYGSAIYRALKTTEDMTPGAVGSDMDWALITPRAVLMSAPDTNAADILWGSASHQAQVLAAGGTSVKLSVDTSGLLSIYAKGTISNVVNYVIFE